MANMANIEEPNGTYRGRTDLAILKAEILSALSSVGTARTPEELLQANAAYMKALRAARNMGYLPHIRAADDQQIHLEWVAVCESSTAI
jgi:hypothetical protein